MAALDAEGLSRVWTVGSWHTKTNATGSARTSVYVYTYELGRSGYVRCHVVERRSYYKTDVMTWTARPRVAVSSAMQKLSTWRTITADDVPNEALDRIESEQGACLRHDDCLAHPKLGQACHAQRQEHEGRDTRRPQRRRR